MKKHSAHRWWIGAAVAFLAAVAFSVFDAAQFGLEERSLDLRFQLRGPRPVDHSPLVLVTVDNLTLKALNQRWPFPRTYFTRVLRNLKRLGVRMIVSDVMFSEDAASDSLDQAGLAQAVADCAPVILSGQIVYEAEPPRLDLPLPSLMAAGQPWALVNVDISGVDRANRLYPLYLPSPANGEAIPTLGARLLLLEDSLRGRGSGSTIESGDEGWISLGGRPVRLEPGQGNATRINFYGPDGTWRHYPFYCFMDDSSYTVPVDSCETDYVETFADTALYRLVFGDEPSPFRGKIAVIGVSATELHDDKYTPFFGYRGDRRLMPGVEVHAHAVQTMLDGSWIVNPLPGWRAWLLFALIAAVASWLTSRLGPLRGLLLLLLVEACWLALAQWAFSRHNLWLEVAAPAVALVVAWTVNVLQQFLQARRERAQIRGMFAQYVPEAVVAELIKNPGLLVLGGEEREISALFSDVEGFTSVSERLSPTELVELLNEYLTEMTQIITDEGGIIDKYEGDAIIAEFGAPLPCQDHAARAVRSALHMQARLAELREDWARRGKPLLKARVGINSGMMVVGNMGSRQIFDYTAMGDSMNLASRLEPANKHYGSYILLSGFCWTRLEGAFIGRQLDDIRVKGKSEIIAVWEPLGGADHPRAEALRAQAAAFAAARALYLARDFSGALAAFGALAATDPEDGPARHLAERCRLLLAAPPAPDWDGVFNMTDK